MHLQLMIDHGPGIGMLGRNPKTATCTAARAPPVHIAPGALHERYTLRSRNKKEEVKNKQNKRYTPDANRRQCGNTHKRFYSEINDFRP
ncbi:MAG: hypothetical protein KGM95_09730 [Betaproteobacteria bacterium]|nr:hypothetical protein [Betaproteobacteria bacterium]